MPYVPFHHPRLFHLFSDFQKFVEISHVLTVPFSPLRYYEIVPFVFLCCSLDGLSNWV